jgi:hypothetical protein
MAMNDRFPPRRFVIALGLGFLVGAAGSAAAAFDGEQATIDRTARPALETIRLAVARALPLWTTIATGGASQGASFVPVTPSGHWRPPVGHPTKRQVV